MALYYVSASDNSIPTPPTPHPTAVITTIQQPTEGVIRLQEIFGPSNVRLIGDEKTPDFERLFTLEKQREYMPEMSDAIPLNHYARKNIGYLFAMLLNAPVIYDTDDDNIPNANFQIRSLECQAVELANKGWCNVYSGFQTLKDYVHVWPRGLSLQHIDKVPEQLLAVIENFPIQQGLADHDPDVDAIFRLTGGEDVRFKKHISFALPEGCWCPFNSQSTWWFPDAYPLLYLPIHATFRMTDIWRSFVAQRCLWQMGYKVAFHSPSEVLQKRNEHNLLKDFEQEIPGYLHNNRIVEALESLTLGVSVYDNMLICYEKLIDLAVLSADEMKPLMVWVEEVKKLLPEKEKHT